jgi:hypothetical protein
MSEKINHDRRRSFGTVARTIAAAQFAMMGSAAAQSSKTNPQVFRRLQRSIEICH